jgi:hypothetical protein
MRTQVESSTRSTRAIPAADDARRPSAEERSRKAEMKLLEQLRKLRRERAELAMRNAQSKVIVAQELVVERRKQVTVAQRQYRSSQDTVTQSLNAGRSSLDEIRQLLDGVDRVRMSLFQAQTQVVVQVSEVRAAETELQKARDATRVAATAHEKVLEWKRSV